MRLVIIGDIVNSRELTDRSGAQELFRQEVQQLNADYPEQILSPMTVTLGDEFQGVLASANRLFLVIHQLQINLRKHRDDLEIRFGLGLGEILTEINTESAIGMDGPAFHAAREALDIAKREDRQFAFQSEDNSAVLLDLHCTWIHLALSSWKSHRLAMMHYHRLGESQQRIEQRLNVSQPAISQNLSNPETKLVLRTEKGIEAFLQQQLGAYHGTD